MQHDDVFVCMIAQLSFVCFESDPTQPNMAEEGSNVFDAIRRLGVAGKPLEKTKSGRLAGLQRWENCAGGGGL